MKTIVYAALILLLTGCTASSNIKGIERELSAESLQLKELQKKVDSLDSEREDKVSAGQLDPTTDSVTHVYIKKLKDSVNARLGNLKAIISDKRRRETKNGLWRT